MNPLSPEVERRRRLITRMAPLALIGFVAFVVGAVAGSSSGSPEKEAAKRFTAAWQNDEYAAMYKELNPGSRHKISINDFVLAYREAAQIATVRSLQAGSPGSVGSEVPEEGSATETRTVVPVPIAVSTVAFGPVEAQLELPFAEGGVAWEKRLTFPGLREGEHLESQIELAPRASILAADGTPLAEGPAEARAHPIGSEAIDVTGEVGTAEEGELEALARQGFTPETPVGVTGLERAFNARLAGRPGGSLLAARSGGSTRTLAEAKPKPGAPVKTTIDTGLQESAVAALAGRVGGIAVLDARNGDIRALAGQAFSAPQPPGSTFKMVTTAAALQKGVVSLDDEFEITSGANVGGRFIENANGELCGGTFRQAFAESCNADFAPLGPKIGNDELVAMAEGFGFNSPPTLYAPRIIAHVNPEESTIPSEIGEEVDLGVSAIGQGEVPGDPAGDGERGADDRQRRRARADLDRRQLEAAPRCQAGAGDLEEDRRGADRTDGRRRHRRNRHSRRDPPGPGRGQDRHRRAGAEAGRRGIRTPPAAQGRLVRRLRPGRKGQAGDRRAAGRSGSGGGRSGGSGGLRSALGGTLSRPRGWWVRLCGN